MFLLMPDPQLDLQISATWSETTAVKVFKYLPILCVPFPSPSHTVFQDYRNHLRGLLVARNQQILKSQDYLVQ